MILRSLDIRGPLTTMRAEIYSEIFRRVSLHLLIDGRLSSLVWLSGAILDELEEESEREVG